MFKKLKQKKQNSNKKNYQIILVGLCLFFAIFFTQKIYAQTAEEAAAATNLATYVQPVMTYFWGLLTQLTTGLVYLIFSAFLLQTTINNSAAWIDVHSNFVKIGLTFTTGVADVLLIAVFIAIAIGYVFKIETFKSDTKRLITFFVAALLIHFAPLFVGMITDISNILIKGIMIGKEDLFTSVFVNDFGPGILFSIGTLGLTFSAAALASMAGILGTVANYGVLVLAVSNLLIGVPVYIIQIMIMNIIAGLLFSTAMFFLTRVFVIQILTILAPLAILANALPQTQNYFDMWKKWIIEWSFGGVLYLFLMVLGLTGLEMLGSLPKGAGVSVGFGEWAVNLVMDRQFKWIAIAIYMMTVDTICIALIPTLAGTFTEKIKGGANAAKGMAGETGKRLQGRVFDSATSGLGYGTEASRAADKQRWADQAKANKAA